MAAPHGEGIGHQVGTAEVRPTLVLIALACCIATIRGASAEVTYTVEVTRTDGAEDGLLSDDPLLEVVRGASELVSLEDRPARTRATLQSRIETDEERLVRVLRAEGYYDGTVEIAVTDLPAASDPAETAGGDETDEVNEDDAAAQPPARVTITITPGPQYTLRTYQIDNAHPYKAPFPIDFGLDDLGIALGDPATGRAITAAQDDLLDMLGERGRPFAEVVDRIVIADHADAAVDVTLTVDAGPEASFGALEIEGLEDVDAALVRDRLEWVEGERYDEASVADTRTALAQLEVFSAVTIEPAEDWVNPDGTLPMRVRVTERPHRTIGGGISYSTTDGAGAQAYWRHRNLLGEAEQIELKLQGSQQLQQFSVDYRDISVFRDPRYALTAELNIGHESRRNFESRFVEGAVGMSYALDDELSFSGGIRAAFSDVDEEEAGKDRYLLVGLPLGVNYDLRDDSFNPTEGGLTRFAIEPLLITPDPNVVGLRTTLYQTGYWAPFEDDSVVLAGWGQFGSVFGSGSASLPADERFYVGGGGSVRGFAYQLAGDLDRDNDPLGGRSMVALGTEARFRFWDDYGLVAFVEGGRSYEGTLPTFNQPLFWGAGAGARYYTDFGPVRLDVAVPLNGRSGVDGSFQLYISFGQAF